MPVQNDPRMYSGGAVALDSSPSVNMYAQLMAKKQAKEEAIDEYYKKLPSTLNSAGMREQSIPGFNEAVGQTQKYWAENKDKIRKGTTPEAFNYDKMFRELEQKVNEDKNAAKTDLELGKMRFNKENGYIFKDKKFIDNLTQHGLSVFDPNHRAIDLGTVTLPVKPFDAKDQDEYYKSITTGMEAGKKYDYSKQYTNPQTGQVIVPTIDVLNDDQIGKAAKRAMELVAEDESKQSYFEDLLHSPNKKDWQALQDAYTSFKDANGKRYFEGDVMTAEQAAAADAIIKLSIPKKYAEEQESNYAQKQQDKRINIQLNLSRGRGSDDVANYDILRKYEPKAVSKTMSIVVPTSGSGTQTVTKTEKIIPASEVPVHHRDLIKTKPYTDPKDGSQYYILKDDGDWEGSNGQVISWETVAQAEMDRVTAAEARRGRQNLSRSGNAPAPKPTTKKGELD